MRTETQGAFTAKSVIAAEMGQEWFKLVHVDLRGRAPSVSRIVVKSIEEMGGVATADVARGLKALDVAHLPVIACLPRQMVNIRLFDLPSGDPREIDDMIDLQISRQTPYSRDEIVFDYRLIPSDRAGYTRVMLAIAQAAVVQHRFRIFEEAGFSIHAMTVSTEGWLIALVSSLSSGDDAAGPALFLDLDSATGDALVIQKGIPLFSRSIAVGAQDLLAAREKWEGKFIQEVGRAVETFRTEMASSKIESITISGATAGLPWIAPRLEEEFRVPVRTGDVSGMLKPNAMSKFADDPRLKGVSLSGLIGAAAGVRDVQINLMPPSVKVRKAIVEKARDLSVFAAMILTILALMTLWVESRLSAKQAYLDALDAYIENTKGPADAIEAMRQKVAIVASRMESAMMPVYVLMELQARLLDDVNLTSLEIDRQRNLVTCRGTADSVNRLVSSLEASPFFRNVKTIGSTKVKDAMEFEITLDVEKR